jgi:hypothetical protein
MASHAKAIADSEIEGRKQIQFCEYSDALVRLAEDFVIVGKRMLKHSPLALNDKDVAHVAIQAAMYDFDDDHWTRLRFIASSDREVIKKFNTAFQRHVGINYDANIKSKYDGYEGEDHPDEPLITFVATEIEVAIQRLTTEFWAHEEEDEMNRKMDAELSLLYQKREVDKSNNDLGDAMEQDEGEAIESHIWKSVNKELDKRISKKKKEARKNTSGSGKNHPSANTEDGHNSAKKSKKKKEKKKRESSRRYESNSDDSEDSYESRHRRSWHRHDNDDSRNRSHRGRTHGDDRRPRPILRRRSVSWGRDSTSTPPRSRYSREEPSRQRGTSYHGSRSSRGGRGGRGGSQKGRGRGGGKKK